MSTHAPIPPSSAARIVACPGSRKMEALYPQDDTIDTQEGEAAHWGGAELLRGDAIAVGQVAPNGIVLNAEMVEAAEMYADHIIKRDGNWYEFRGIEQMVRNSVLHNENYGTPDYWSYVGAEHALYVDDFKFGHGYVTEWPNWQLIDYAALLASELDAFDDDALTVTMTIHQPRSFHRRGPIREFTTTLGKLRPHFARLSAAFSMSMHDDAPVIASADACKDCSARHACEAAIAAGYDAIGLAYDSVPLVMSPAALSKEYRRLVQAEKMIKARREGIEQSILSTIKRGGVVPYFAMMPKKGRLMWQDDAIQNGILDVAAAMNVKIDKPGLITPLQAIKAGIPEEVVNAYSHAPTGAVELVEDDGTYAANVFNKEQ